MKLDLLQTRSIAQTLLSASDRQTPSLRYIVRYLLYWCVLAAADGSTAVRAVIFENVSVYSSGNGKQSHRNPRSAQVKAFVQSLNDFREQRAQLIELEIARRPRRNWAPTDVDGDQNMARRRAVEAMQMSS